jgi:adenosyl cobinamide kinase/adenosyl cobinamide phosphate guanylyltransferase
MGNAQSFGRRTLTLILGGARSGKSRRAVEIARSTAVGTGGVLFVATAEARDEEMAIRIAAHRRERPAEWRTLEEPQALADCLSRDVDRSDLIVIDCLTLWVSNLMDGADPLAFTSDIDVHLAGLLAAYRQGRASWIVVSNEVGLGLVPDTVLGRAYRDALGAANRSVAAEADRVILMVAGLSLDLKPSDTPAI